MNDFLITRWQLEMVREASSDNESYLSSIKEIGEKWLTISELDAEQDMKEYIERECETYGDWSESFVKEATERYKPTWSAGDLLNAGGGTWEELQVWCQVRHKSHPDVIEVMNAIIKARKSEPSSEFSVPFAEAVSDLNNAINNIWVTLGLSPNVVEMAKVASKYWPGRTVWIADGTERVLIKCPSCNGKGSAVINDNKFHCTHCNGRGNHIRNIPSARKSTIESIRMRKNSIDVFVGNRAMREYDPSHQRRQDSNTVFFLDKKSCQDWVDNGFPTGSGS